MDIKANNTSAQVEQTQGSSPLATGLKTGLMGATAYTLLAPLEGLMTYASVAGPKVAVCAASAVNTHKLVDATLRTNEFLGNPMNVGLIENYTSSYTSGFGAAMTCAMDFSSEQSTVNAFRAFNYAGSVASLATENGGLGSGILDTANAILDLNSGDIMSGIMGTANTILDVNSSDIMGGVMGAAKTVLSVKNGDIMGGIVEAANTILPADSGSLTSGILTAADTLLTIRNGEVMSRVMTSTADMLLAPVANAMTYASVAGPKAAVCAASAGNTRKFIDLTLQANEYLGNPMDVGMIENYTSSYLGGFGAAMSCAMDFSPEQSTVNAFRALNYAGSVASFVAENSATIGLVGAGMFAVGYAIASASKSSSK